MATEAGALVKPATAPPSKRGSSLAEVVKPGTAPSPNRASLNAALPLVIPEKEEEIPDSYFDGDILGNSDAE